MLYALLVLNKKGPGVRVIVKVRDRKMKEKVIALLEDNNGLEAFNYLKQNAEVERILPEGVRPPQQPVVTLIEDLL